MIDMIYTESKKVEKRYIGFYKLLARWIKKMFGELETNWIERSWLNGDKVYKIVIDIRFINRTISLSYTFEKTILNKTDITGVYKLYII